ncbi:MAG: copper homeostasis protein CutC [Anditalea sp.]
MEKLLLEAPVYTLEAALLAPDFGIDRLELCADYGEGGTTPGAGMLAYVKSKIQVPVFAMVRPRGGDFVYSKEELEVMKKEISILKSCGADGFVFGVLQADGKVHRDACSSLVKMSDGLPCSFHRAFDASANLEQSLETIIECGFKRILTSGGRNTVTEGLEMIKNLLLKAEGRIIIMPGGGTAPEHLKELHATGFLREIHASCKTLRLSNSTYFNPYLKLSGGGDTADKVLTVDKTLVETFHKEIDKLGR